MNSNTNVVVNWRNSRNFNEFLQANSNTENGLDMQEIGMVRVLIYFESNDMNFSTEKAQELLRDGMFSIRSTVNKLIQHNVLIRHPVRKNGKNSYKYELIL